MKTTPSNALLWFAVLGGAGAWAVQFVVNLAFTLAQCDQPAQRWVLPVHTWEIALSVVAIVVTLAALAVAFVLFRRSFAEGEVGVPERRGFGVAPPAGRVNFLAMVGLTVNFLALAIIVLTGIGAPLLPVCQQS